MDLDQSEGHQHDLMDYETANKHAVDMQLAMQILRSVDLAQTCVNWDQGFVFLLHHFQPEVLLEQHINTYSFLAGDGRQLFRMANIAALTLLGETPRFYRIPRCCISPCTRVSINKCPPCVNGIRHTCTKAFEHHCQKLLGGEWQLVYHAALKILKQECAFQ